MCILLKRILFFRFFLFSRLLSRLSRAQRLLATNKNNDGILLEVACETVILVCKKNDSWIRMDFFFFWSHTLSFCSTWKKKLEWLEIMFNATFFFLSHSRTLEHTHTYMDTDTCFFCNRTDKKKIVSQLFLHYAPVLHKWKKKGNSGDFGSFFLERQKKVKRKIFCCFGWSIENKKLKCVHGSLWPAKLIFFWRPLIFFIFLEKRESLSWWLQKMCVQ